MCGFVKEVLNVIKEPFSCTVDGVTQKYESGSVAVEQLSSALKVSHNIESISTDNGKLCVVIVDRQKEIDESNKVWMAEQKRQTGVEPSFF